MRSTEQQFLNDLEKSSGRQIPKEVLEQAVHELMTVSEQTDVWDTSNQIQAYKEVYHAV